MFCIVYIVRYLDLVFPRELLPTPAHVPAPSQSANPLLENHCRGRISRRKWRERWERW